MPEITLPSRHGDWELSLPDHWQVQQVAEASLRPAAADWPDRLARALNQPTSGQPLARLLEARRRERIVLIVEDTTRHSPLPALLEPILREIDHAGIDRAAVEVVFATGMHVPMTPERAREKLGEIAGQLPFRCNPWQDPSAYRSVGRVGKVPVEVDAGVLSAGLRIVVSSVSPHLQAGFGGGYKMFLPGCASLETIRGLHRLGLPRHARQLVGTAPDRNAMRRTIDAGGALVDAAGGRTFAVQYVLDADDQPTFLAAGEPVPTHRMTTKQCAAACGIITPAPADVVIANAHPRDTDLWQSFKGVANTCWAARRNGAVICLARCEHAMEGMTLPAWPLSPTWTRRVVRLLGPGALASLTTRVLPGLAEDAAFFVHMALQMLHRNRILLVSPALAAQPRRFPGLEVFAEPAAAIASAERELGPGPRRVIVFPAGGSTFPIAPGEARQ